MITEGVCLQAKGDFLRGLHSASDSYRLALYVESADIGPHTDSYTSAGEVKGEGYSAGGGTVAEYTVALDGGAAVLTLGDAVWPRSEIKAHGALLYNASKDGAAIAVFKFPREFKSDGGEFRVAPGAVVIG